MIKFSEIAVSFNGREVLSDISFEVKKNEWVFFSGDTGSGKTSILLLLTGDKIQDIGKIKVFGDRIYHSNHYLLQNYRRNLGICLQDFKLIPQKTIAENISYVLYIRGEGSKQIEKKLKNVLQKVGIQDISGYYPEELSAGERQKALLARALVSNPKILILDDISSYLDEKSKKSIFSLLSDIKKKGGITVVGTGNDMKLLKKISDKIFEIDKGKLTKIK